MLETGQPLHFYDADKLGNKIIVRQANDKETLTTLDGVDRILSSDDIVIADDKTAIGLAGVMGGLSTEVDENTKNIIIEAAIFDGTKVRKTAKNILRSEASNRFEKGLDPKRTEMAVKRSASLLQKYADATILSDEVIHNKINMDDKKIDITVDKINKVLGTNIEASEVVDIFKSLGFGVENNNKLTVTVPTRRKDISIAEDLVEEVGRIYGMDKILSHIPKLDVIPGKYNYIKREIRHKMASLGLNETLSYSLISKDDVHTFTNDKFEEVELNDPMSSDRNTLRYSILSSLKDIYLYNKTHGNNNVSIFEISKGFYKEYTYKEDEKLACLVSGDYYLDIPNKKVDFYIIKGIVEELFDYLGYKSRYSFVVDDNIPKELHPAISASINLQGKNVGVIGKVHPSVLKDDVYVFEINLSKVLENKVSKMSYKEIPKYPKVEKDVAFIVDKNVKAEDIVNIIRKGSSKILNEVSIFDIYEGEKIDSNKKSIAFKLIFLDINKTLTDDEVMKEFNNIIDKVKKGVNATLRDS